MIKLTPARMSGSGPGSGSGDRVVKMRCSKILKNEGREVDAVQHKVICIPEILAKILGYLDMRSLRQVRLVCKRWLLQAQPHMERKGTVRLVTPGRFNEDRFLSFLDTCKSKLPDLPMPFQALNVVVYNSDDELFDSVFSELLSLPAPLVITRLDTGDISPKTVIPLIIRVSSRLEYFRLKASDRWEGKDIVSLDPNQQLPKLRHINLQASDSVEDNAKAQFLALVPWLVSSSPNLETFELFEWGEDGMEFISSLVMEVDIRDVKALNFRCDSGLNAAALSHLISIPFRRLEALKFNLSDNSVSKQALTAVFRTSFLTLKELDLSWMDLGEEDQARFPVCPNVQQLRLTWFPYSNDFVPAHFPSLQTMTLWESCFDEGCLDVSTPPFLGLKRLRLKECLTSKSDQSFNSLLEKFPSVEHLSIDDSNLQFGFTLISRGLPNTPNLLRGVKHLVLDANLRWSHMDYAGWYCLLSVLIELESIELNTTQLKIITTLPVKELPRLTVIQFPWNDRFHVPKLLEITGGVKKVLISNCCSMQRGVGFSSSNHLKAFFKSAPNAHCGCGTSPWKTQWFPEGKFLTAS